MTASLALSLPAHLSDGDRRALADIFTDARDHRVAVLEKRRELIAAIKLGNDFSNELGASSSPSTSCTPRSCAPPCYGRRSSGRSTTKPAASSA